MTAPVRYRDGHDKIRSLMHLKDEEFDEYMKCTAKAEWHKAFACYHAILFFASWIVMGVAEPKGSDFWIFLAFPMFFAVMTIVARKRYKRSKDRVATLSWNGLL